MAAGHPAQMDGQQIIGVNGVDLCVDTAGDAADPAILLIGGMGGSMDWWEEEFCQRLAAGGRFVIRYDHRDTGRSVSYPAGAPGYTGADLAADAVGVLAAIAAIRDRSFASTASKMGSTHPACTTGRATG
jgi:pimeloyl-ACP methyl ester carboxylesterase